MHSDDMEKTQKLEIEAVIADYYLEAVGFCEQWDECPSGVDWLELIKSVAGSTLPHKLLYLA